MATDVSELDYCPACGVSWIGEEIPREHQEDFRACHSSRIIGVEYWYGNAERYDGVSEWQCPDCHTRWGRWTGLVIPSGYVESRYGQKGLVPSRNRKLK